VGFAAPAAATDYIFDSVGDQYEVTFNGFGGDPVTEIPGLTSTLDLTLTGGIGTKTLTFAYVLSNTSTAGGPDSRVSGFAFDLDPDPKKGSATGAFSNLNLGGTYPDAIGKVETCLANNKGNGCSGSGGATLSTPAAGALSLVFNSNTPSLTLSDFHVRYQSLSGLGKITSAAGSEVTSPVPEPDTWALMLFGFGAVGFAMRRRKPKVVRVRVAYA
jgi:hypothetical protein